MRKKAASGEQLSDKEDAWLREYEAQPHVSSVYTDSQSTELPPDSAPDTGGELPPLGVMPAPMPPPGDGGDGGKKKRGRPPGSGKKAAGGDKGAGKDGKWQRRPPSDWRSKYAGAAMDREQVCVLIADVYCGFLLKVGEEIERMGSRPIPEEIVKQIVFPATIACADDWLPETTMAPEIVVVGAGSFQAFQYLRAKRKMGEPIDVDEPKAPDVDPDETMPH